MTTQFFIAVAVILVSTFTAAFFSIKRFPDLAFTGVLLYAAVTINISVAYLDNNRILISETNLVSYNTGAAYRCLAYNLTIWAGLACGSMLFNSVRLTPQNPLLLRQLNSLALYATFGALFLFILNAVLTGKQAIYSEAVTKHNYWTEYAKIPQVAEIFGKLFIAFPMVVTIYYGLADSRRAWSKFYWSMAVYVLILAISGAKFHAFLVPISLVAGCFLCSRLYYREPLLTHSEMMGGLVVFVLFLAYGTLNVMTRGIARDSEGPFEALTIRFLHLQGGTYWSCDHLSETRRLGPELFVSDMTHIVEEIVTLGMVKDFNELKVNLAVGLPATSVLAVGKEFAWIPCFLFGLFYAGVFFVLKIATIQKNLSLAVLGSYQWLWAGSVFARGTLEQVFEIKFCIVTVMVLVLAGLTLRVQPLRERWYGSSELRTSV